MTSLWCNHDDAHVVSVMAGPVIVVFVVVIVAVVLATTMKRTAGMPSRSLPANGKCPI